MKRFFLFVSLCLALTPMLALVAFGQGYQPPTRLAIKSEVLGEERVILVQTPASYANGKQRYPDQRGDAGDATIQCQQHAQRRGDTFAAFEAIKCWQR